MDNNFSIDSELEDFSKDNKNMLKEVIRNIIDDYKATLTPPTPTFRAKHFKCAICHDEIYSQYPGHFSQCKCGNSFVDQDEYIIRMGGNPVALNIRNPKRIPVILDMLQRLWEKTPDMRLGQLIEAAIGEELFYIEDEDIINKIDLFLKDITYEQINIEGIPGNGEVTSEGRVGDNSSKE